MLHYKERGSTGTSGHALLGSGTCDSSIETWVCDASGVCDVSGLSAMWIGENRCHDLGGRKCSEVGDF